MQLQDLLLSIHKGRSAFALADMTGEKFELIVTMLQEAEDDDLIAELQPHYLSDGSGRCDLVRILNGLTDRGREYIGVSGTS